MTAWLLRALVLGSLVVVLRVLLGFAMGTAPTWGTLWRAACLVLIIGAAAAWGLRDARSGGGEDLVVRWLGAGIVAGLGSGAVCLVLGYVPGIELGGGGVLFELTASASFILLLVFLPALAGVAYGRRARREKVVESASPATEPEFAPAQ